MRFEFVILTLVSLVPVTVISISLSPSTWPAGELQYYTSLLDFKGDKPTGYSKDGQGIVSGTSSSLAVHVATDVLRKGGNAADAAIAASMAQIVIAGGTYVSFAGLTSFVYFDSSTNESYSLNAVFNKPINYDSMIKGNCDGIKVTLECIGSHALVPGYFKGIEALWKRFGSLPWNTLFEPAIYFARTGFQMPKGTAAILSYFQGTLKTTESKSVFTNPITNKTYAAGEIFTQPGVAAVLQTISDAGNVDMMYTGSWASSFIESMNKYGGNLTAQDMSDYKVIWGNALTPSFKSDTMKINTLNVPSVGGLAVIETLNLIETLQFPTNNKYNESGLYLHQLVEAARWSPLIQVIAYYYPSVLTQMFPEADLSFEGRLTKSTAAAISKILFQEDTVTRMKRWNKFYKMCPTLTNNACQYSTLNNNLPVKPKGHSDALSIIDKDNNAISMVHSINSMPFGTGLTVQGVTIPDGTAANQGPLHVAKGGEQIPNLLEPVIVTYNGLPYLAQGTIGGGLHEYSIINLVNVLNYYLTPKQAVMMPKFQGIQFLSSGCFPLNQTIFEGVSTGGFDPIVVTSASKSYGSCFNVLNGPLGATSTGDPGYIAIAFKSPTSKLMLSATDNQLNGWSEGVTLINNKDE